MGDSLFHVPFPRPNLVGRENDLRRLHEAISRGSTAVTPALAGQGGVGKTQLAVTYCYQHARDFPGGVFWLNAADTTGLVGQVADHATRLGLKAVSEIANQNEFRRQRAIQWISAVRNRPDVLIVLDNLDEDSLLRLPIPGIGTERITALGCRLLITSRRRELPNCEALPVDSLGPEAARDLLLRDSGRKPTTEEAEAALGDILSLLGGLPLALRLAGAILKRAKKSLPEIAAILRERGAVAVTDRAQTLGDYEKSLTAVMVESWNNLPADRPKLQTVLQALSCLPMGRQIPVWLVTAMVGLETEDEFGLDLNDPFQELVDRSLLEQPVEGMLRLHPLIHEYANRQCQNSLREQFTERALQKFLAPDFLHEQSSGDFLRLAEALHLLPVSDQLPSTEIRTLNQFKRVLDLQAHHLRHVDRSLPQLLLGASQLEGDALTVALQNALGSDSRPWPRLHWSTRATDPALRRILEGHSDDVNWCAISPDGRSALSASSDQTLRLWDLNSGQCSRVLVGHSADVWSCAISPDGRNALSASYDQTLRLWDLDSGQCSRVLKGHSGSVWSCAINFDGRSALSASSDQTLRLWDLDSGECSRVLVGHLNWVRGCAISPDGRSALSASKDRTLRLWDLDSGRCTHVFEGHSGPVWSCAISSDGCRALSASQDKTLRIWDINSGQCTRVLVGHSGRIRGCAISPDGLTALSASSDQTLCIWDINFGQRSRVLAGHSDRVRACAISPDGRSAVSASHDQTLCIWDLDPRKCSQPLVGHSSSVLNCAISPDGRSAVSASHDQTLCIWDINSGQCTRVLEGHSSLVRGCALSADGRVALSASDDQTLRLWNLSNGDCLLTVRIDGLSAATMDPGGKFVLLGTATGTVTCLEIQNLP